jgi:Uma2 family endonuclease
LRFLVPCSGENAARRAKSTGQENELVAILPQSHLTPEEYLARERNADRKSEYFDGVVLAMAGASEQHNLMVANVIMAIGPQLKKGCCRIYPSDLKVRAGSRFFYPDVSVICGETVFADERRDVVLNPTLIVEVLSESTMAYDRGPKFLAYQQIASLQDYLLVHQDDTLVEHYRRHPPNAWLYTKSSDLDAVIDIPNLGCKAALFDIYPS